MLNEFDADDLDIDFHIPAKHRLRFTKDVFGEDAETLVTLLEASGDRTARVQFWLDEDVLNAQPGLKQKLYEFSLEREDKFHMVGNVQVVPGGEAIKNDIHILERMLKVMNAADLDRRSYVVVIGGGAVLDAVGFAASIAHRGIRLVRIPSTTLAQGDSGVGVKSAVNLFQKKNWVGSFSVPWAVINDQKMLETLPDRDFLCGFSEAVKVTLLKDREAYLRCMELAPRIRERDIDACTEIIKLSAKYHLMHITRGGDPFEALEARPLDFGHWSAHKLEVISDFELRHGEAVAIGVAIDVMYSAMKLSLPMEDAEQVLQTLHNMGMVLDHWSLDHVDELFEGLEEFRQHLGGRLTITMLSGLGDSVDVHQIDESAMRMAIGYVRAWQAASV